MMSSDEEMFNLTNYLFLNLSNKRLFFIAVDRPPVYLGHAAGAGRPVEHRAGGGVV